MKLKVKRLVGIANFNYKFYVTIFFHANVLL